MGAPIETLTKVFTRELPPVRPGKCKQTQTFKEYDLEIRRRARVCFLNSGMISSKLQSVPLQIPIPTSSRRGSR